LLEELAVGGGNGGLLINDDDDDVLWELEFKTGVDCADLWLWLEPGVPGEISGLLLGSGGPGVPTSDLYKQIRVINVQ